MQDEPIASLHNAVPSNVTLETTVKRFARIAGRLCAVPAARLRLAPPRQHCGDDASTDVGRAPLEDALFTLTLTQCSPLVIPDICADTTLTQPDCPPEYTPFRFFAGIPLHSSDQQVLGVLYVLDYVPRILSDEDRDALLTLGQTAAEQLELLQSCLPEPLPESVLTYRPTAASQEGIIVIDQQGTVLEWNQAAEVIFGYTRDQTVGRLLADLVIPTRLREQHDHGMVRYRKTGEGPVLHRHTELSALRADGREIPIELMVVPAPKKPGKPLRFTGYVRDITAKQQARAALQQVYDDLIRTNQTLRNEASQRAQAEAAVANLNQSLLHANQELTRAYDTTIEGWARALDMRDKETEGHSRRVTEVAVRLARCLDMCPHEQIHLRRGALLHDIGKMGIPDHILHKPGPLDEAEWEIMRRHPAYARDMLMPIDFLRPALDVPYCHHEKWDGTGYPRGLKGEEIPLAARIFSIVDVWDALCSNRPYRPAWTEEQVNQYIAEQAGYAFDPLVVRMFLTMLASENRAPSQKDSVWSA